MIFDGKAFAEDIINRLSKCDAKLAVFLDLKDAGSVKYVEIKQKVAQKLGVNFEIVNSLEIENCKLKIKLFNADPGVTGIMIQLPFPNSKELIKLIAPEKDVDGLREDSPYLPAAVLAVEKILNAYSSEFMVHRKIAIVGNKGFIGQKLVKLLRTTNNKLITIDKDNFDPEKIKLADIVVSATGQESLIEDIKQGAVCIDLGFPKGDFAPELASKASFFTPVPGGVGPVTVACLFENLYGTIPLLHTSPDSPYKHRRRED